MHLTYEELKLMLKMIESLSDNRLHLTYEELKHEQYPVSKDSRNRRFHLTYEELKLMRYERFCRFSISLYLTYEELKHISTLMQ